MSVFLQSGDAVANAATSRRLWVQFRAVGFLCRVEMFSLGLCGFSPRSPASFHSIMHVMETRIFWFQRGTSGGFRVPSSQYVKEVTISHGRDSSFASMKIFRVLLRPCQREMLGYGSSAHWLLLAKHQLGSSRTRVNQVCLIFLLYFTCRVREVWHAIKCVLLYLDFFISI